MPRCRLFAGPLAALFVVTLHADPVPSFRGLGLVPGERRSDARVINADASLIVGGGRFRDNTLWRNGVVEPFPDDEFFITGVSADGLTLIGDTPTGRAAYWRDGVLTELPISDDLQPIYARGVSGDGSVIVGAGSPTGFRWQAGAATALGGLPGFNNAYATGVSADGRVVFGSAPAGASVQAFRWENGSIQGLGGLPGELPYSVAYAASADGSVIVGTAQDEDSKEPVMWTNGVVSPLRPAGEDNAGATVVSADGTIILGDLGYRTFIWDQTGGFRDLQDWLETDVGLDLTGWTLAEVIGITADNRTIVGNGYVDGHPEAWIATIPEPHTAVLLLAGLAAAGRRRAAPRA